MDVIPMAAEIYPRSKAHRRDPYIHLLDGPDGPTRFACTLAGGESPPYREPYSDAAAAFLQEANKVRRGQHKPLHGALADAMALERNPIVSEWAHIAAPKVELALAQRDCVERCGERRDRGLFEKQLQAAERELAELRRAQAAACAPSPPTTVRLAALPHSAA